MQQVSFPFVSNHFADMRGREIVSLMSFHSTDHQRLGIKFEEQFAVEQKRA